MNRLAHLVPCLAVLAALAQPSPAGAQSSPAAAPASGGFSQAQLEQLVAPIALYPDALLSQILMASTYPLEIVEAQRWAAQNPGLTGTQLEEALKSQDWDPSVKSLCGFPDVLKNMGDNLDWTQDLGDAFLGQKSQLMDAVQVMRGKAYSAGNLKSSEQQAVKQDAEKIIVIESKDPEVIYVPTYSPTVVYAGWGYPSWYYPAFYYPPPPGYGFLAFTAGVAWGAAVWGGCHWGWGHSDVDIDINRQNNFNRNTNINANRFEGGGQGRQGWQHDASHRKGVNYRDAGTATKYGGTGATSRVSSAQARGRVTSPTASTRPAGAAQRPSGSLGTGAATRPSTGASSLGTNRSGAGATRAASPSAGSSRGSSAFSGAGSSSASRSYSSRGASSRGSASYGGGMSRGGGGMSRGGGRR